MSKLNHFLKTNDCYQSYAISLAKQVTVNVGTKELWLYVDLTVSQATTRYVVIVYYEGQVPNTFDFTTIEEAKKGYNNV